MATTSPISDLQESALLDPLLPLDDIKIVQVLTRSLTIEFRHVLRISLPLSDSVTLQVPVYGMTMRRLPGEWASRVELDVVWDEEVSGTPLPESLTHTVKTRLRFHPLLKRIMLADSGDLNAFTSIGCGTLDTLASGMNDALTLMRNLEVACHG